jgi:hypothetical protein
MAIPKSFLDLSSDGRRTCTEIQEVEGTPPALGRHAKARVSVQELAKRRGFGANRR